MKTALLSFVVLLFLGFIIPSLAQNRIDDNIKTNNAIIWHEDFDSIRWQNTVVKDSFNGFSYDGVAGLPNGFSVVDSNQLGFYWHWSNVGPRGAYIATPNSFNPVNSVLNQMKGSTANGFMILESDFYNTKPDGTPFADADFVHMNSYFQFGPVDLSQHQEVNLSFWQSSMFCCAFQDTLKVMISTDFNPENPQAATWHEFPLDIRMPLVNFGPPYVELNVSEVAGGKPSVYFRVLQKGLTHYFWAIDDITLTDQSYCNFEAKDFLCDYLASGDPNATDPSRAFTGGYTKIPVSLADRFISFRAVAKNIGTNVKKCRNHVAIYKDGLNVYDEFSPFTDNLEVGSIDTVVLSTAYKLDGIGFYQVSGSIESDVPDISPENNHFSYSFEVDSLLYSRVNKDSTDKYTMVWSGMSYDWAGGFIRVFDLPANLENIKPAGIRFFVPSLEADSLAYLREMIISGYCRVTPYFATGEVQDGQLVIQDEFYNWGESDISEEDLGTWVTLPLESELKQLPVFGVNKKIVAGIHIYYIIVKKNDDLGFVVGADPTSIKQPENTSFIKDEYSDEWISIPQNLAIDLLMFNPDIINTLTFKATIAIPIGDGDFNPELDKIYISGDMNDWAVPGDEGSILLTNDDQNWVYTASIPVQMATHYEYNYFINSGWEQPEPLYPNHRDVFTGIDDMVQEDWLYLGVNENQMSDLYITPNPFKTKIQLSQNQNLRTLSVFDVTGKILLTINLTNNQTEADLSQLVKGAYMIKISDKAGNVKSFKVIKN